MKERIQENGLEEDAIDEQIRKMELAYQLTKNICNKRC